MAAGSNCDMVMNKVGIIGYGNMGAAIAERIKAAYTVSVFDKQEVKIRGLSGVSAVLDCVSLVRAAQTIILAVKPQDFSVLLREIRPVITPKQLVISIAAGITTRFIEELLGSVRVIRAMPNIAAKIGSGVVCLSRGSFTAQADLDFADGLFRNTGKVLIIEEGMMNAATAISGSGPGFFCDLVQGKSAQEIQDFSEKVFIPSFSVTAHNLGFSPEQARLLAQLTARGTIQYLDRQRLSAEEVKIQVTSKNGTTEAGLRVLNRDINNLTAAAKAALIRAAELSI